MTAQETDLIAGILRNRVGEIKKMLEPKDVVVDNVERAMISSDCSSCPRMQRPTLTILPWPDSQRRFFPSAEGLHLTSREHVWGTHLR